MISLSIQHHNHKVTLHRNATDIRVRLYLQNRLVGSTIVDDLPFHVLADRAHAWLRQRDWPTPADLNSLNP